MNKKTCGFCKHLQIDGMFGIWCDFYGDLWTKVECCQNFEKKIWGRKNE